MSAKNSLTLFRAVKSDYAYLISLMGFSWLSLYGYPGEWEFHDVVATFSFLLILRCKWFHFIMVFLIAIIPIGHYPLLTLKGLWSDNLFTLIYLNPLKALDTIMVIPLANWVPSMILSVLVILLTYLQNVKTAGFNLLRLELGIIALTIVGVTAILNGINQGWSLNVISYAPIHYWVTVCQSWL